MVDRERQATAAGDMESMAVQLKEVARLLRMGVADDMAYALVYEARRRMGTTVAYLGQGAPHFYAKRKAIEALDSQIWNVGPV